MNKRDYISPKLEALKKDYPFRAPQHYFDDFPAKIQQRIQKEKQPSSKSSTRVIDFIKPALGLAAGFAAIFILVYWPVKTLNNRQPELTNLQIEQIISDDYINLLEQFDEETFITLLEKQPNGDYTETESLVAYLATNYNEYDIYMESIK